MQYLNKSQEGPIGEQSPDQTITGKFNAPPMLRDSQISHDVALPPIRVIRERDQPAMEYLVQEILVDGGKRVHSKDFKLTPQRSPDQTRPIRREVVDLRKPQRKGCGSAKCKICSPEKNNPVTNRKKRIASLPDYGQESQLEKLAVSRALEARRRANDRKISQIQGLSEEEKFKMIGIEKRQPKPRRLQELEGDDELGRTFYQEMLINGKVYLVKKKRKKVSEIKGEFQDFKQRANSKQVLYLSRVDSSEQPSYRILTQSSIDHFEQERMRENERREESERRERERQQREQQERHREREELNQIARACIHRETYYQEMERKREKEDTASPQRMRLNTYELDDESMGQKSLIFSRSSSNGGRMRAKGNFERSDEEADEGYQIQFPAISELNDSINNYRPITKKIDVFVLRRSPNFIREYSEAQGEEFLYFGEFDNASKKREGKGVLCTRRRVLEGLWKNGEILDGAELKQNGVYMGQFLGGKKHGEGSYEWINGEKYVGEWREGKRHGKGQWRSRTGDLYVGEWKSGKATGYGEFVTKDDGTYKGEFKNFIKHGRGKHLLPNGDLYVGDFWEGTPSGEGKYMWQDGLTYEGQWNESRREGKGRLWKDQMFEIDGDFHNSLPHGICQCRLANGDVYTGKYSYGDKSGYGNLETSPAKTPKGVALSYSLARGHSPVRRTSGEMWRRG